MAHEEAASLFVLPLIVLVLFAGWRLLWLPASRRPRPPADAEGRVSRRRLDGFTKVLRPGGTELRRRRSIPTRPSTRAPSRACCEPSTRIPISSIRSDYQLLREDQKGHYSGVGMQVGARNGKTVVMAPFPGSPAYKAGIRPGDIISCGQRQAHRQPQHHRGGRPAERAARHPGQHRGFARRRARPSPSPSSATTSAARACRTPSG